MSAAASSEDDGCTNAIQLRSKKTTSYIGADNSLTSPLDLKRLDGLLRKPMIYCASAIGPAISGL